MTNQQWSQIIDLWNEGKSIDEISRHTGIPAHLLGKRLLDAVERNVRVKNNVMGRC